MSRKTDDELLKKFPPTCRLGYTREDLEKYFGAKTSVQHSLWSQLRGQTGTICDGRAECEKAHGYITYVSDVLEWVRGESVSDW